MHANHPARYNAGMKRALQPGIVLRIALPSLLIILSGMSVRARNASAALENARLAVQAGDHASAAVHYSAAAAHSPFRADLWERAAEQAMLAGHQAAAIDHFQQALDLGKLSSQGHISLGRAQASLGDMSTAVQIWEDHLRQFSPSAQVYQLLADAAWQEQDFPQSDEYLQAWIQIDPGAAEAHYRLGLILAATQPNLASAPLTTARELDEAHRAEITILLEGLRPAQFDNPPAYIFTRSGQALGAVAQWQLAHLALGTAVDLDPTYAEAWAFLGEANQQLGESGQVELEVAWGLDPNSLAVNTLLAIQWQRRNDYEQALFFMGRAAEIEPTNASIQADLGGLYLGSGDLESARQHYLQAVDLAPQQVFYWRLLASFCVEHEIFVEENGLPAAERTVALEPQNPENYVLLGRVHFLLLDDAQAMQAYQLALDLNPDFAPAHLYLALLYIRSGEMDAAQRHLFSARDLDEQGEIGLFARQLLAQHFP